MLSGKQIKAWNYLQFINQIFQSKGDIVVRGSSIPSRLPVGANGKILKSNSNSVNGLDWFDSSVSRVTSGRCAMPIGFLGTSSASAAADTVYFCKIYIDEQTTFTDMLFATNVVTAASYKFGIYASTSGGKQPTGSPIAGTTGTVGPFKTSALTSQVLTFVSPVTIEPGFYWMAILPDTTGSINFCSTSSGANQVGVLDAVNIGGRISASRSYASGLPDVGAVSLLYNNTSAPPLLLLKVQ